MIVRKCMLAAMALALAGASPAWAQNKSRPVESGLEEVTANGEAVVTLPTVEVRGINRREELKSTSATILENKDLVDRIYPSPLYFLRQTPGVKISEYSEQGVASSVNIRGFGGGHGGDVAFYMDGIPLNDGGHADNYSDTTIIIPLEVESMEIIKGPASVLYGKGAAGGVAAFQSVKEGDFNRFNLRYGSHNTLDGQGIIAKDDGPLHHVYAFQVFHTDGWRDSNSEWNRYNLSTRWAYDVSEQFKISLNLRAAQAEWDAADRTASWARPETVLVDDGSGEGNMNGGHRDRFDGRLWANYMLNDESQFTFYAFGTTLDNNMAEMTPKGPNPEDRRVYGERAGNDQTNDRRAYGLGLVYNYNGTVLGNHDLALTLGADFLKENEHRRLYNLYWGHGNTHQPGSQYGDTDYTLDTWSIYGDGIYQIIDPLKIRLGLRYDHFSGGVDTGRNHTAWGNPDSHYEAKGQGVFSPKFGLLLSPWENVEFYANYGRGYSMPGLSNGNFFTLDNLKLAKRDQYELGFRSSPFSWMDIGSALYLINTTNDFLNVENPVTGIREQQNAGKTQRKGIETYVKFYPLEHLTLAADYTYQQAEYKKRPDRPDLEGRRFTGVPQHIFNIEAAYAPPEGLGGRASFNWNANIAGYDDPRPSGVNPNIKGLYLYEDYGTLDLQVNYRFNDKYKLNLDVTNVLDDRPQNGIPNDRGNLLYWPQAPRAVYLTLEADFY